MQLMLEGITKRVGAQTWLYDMSIAPQRSAVTVLLGATQAGKTSLMRIMAGLDVPTRGEVLVDGRSVVGVPVRQRNVAMVYQQFINYSSLKVFDNIASPMKLRGDGDIARRVGELAEKLHIETFLDRYPAELSGGQQQRVALARALAKAAPLMLLDEPLVNLDYKLREELRGTRRAVRRRRIDRHLCHYRAERSLAARRPHRGSGPGRTAAVRPDGGGFP
ncbi:MAG: ATP-binding cassette domain-containing protein [Propionivibrio sp.]